MGNFFSGIFGRKPEPALPSEPEPAPEQEAMTEPAPEQEQEAMTEPTAEERREESIESQKQIEPVPPSLRLPLRPDWLPEGNIDIAIVGQSGTGKSSLINALLAVQDGEDGAATVRHTSQGTLEPTSYSYDALFRKLPGYSRYLSQSNDAPYAIKLWDIPGAGTNDFQTDTYVADMGLLFFHVIVINSSARFTACELAVAKAARERGKKVIFTMNKVDMALNSLPVFKFVDVFRSKTVRTKMRNWVEPAVRVQAANELCKMRVETEEEMNRQGAWTSGASETDRLFLVSGEFGPCLELSSRDESDASALAFARRLRVARRPSDWRGFIYTLVKLMCREARYPRFMAVSMASFLLLLQEKAKMRQPIGSVELEVEWRTTARSEVDEEGGNDILQYMGVAAMAITDALLSPSEAVGSGAASTSGSPPEAPLQSIVSLAASTSDAVASAETAAAEEAATAESAGVEATAAAEAERVAEAPVEATAEEAAQPEEPTEAEAPVEATVADSEAAVAEPSDPVFHEWIGVELVPPSPA